MRTKTLLIATAALAASLASSMAQVYSQNVVGYVNTIVPANSVGNGFALIANPLITTNSDLTSVIPPASVPVGTTVYGWTGATFATRIRGTDDNDNPNWNGATVPLVGEGFWTKEAAGTNWVRSFTVN